MTLFESLLLVTGPMDLIYFQRHDWVFFLTEKSIKSTAFEKTVKFNEKITLRVAVLKKTDQKKSQSYKT